MDEVAVDVEERRTVGFLAHDVAVPELVVERTGGHGGSGAAKADRRNHSFYRLPHCGTAPEYHPRAGRAPRAARDCRALTFGATAPLGPVRIPSRIERILVPRRRALRCDCD